MVKRGKTLQLEGEEIMRQGRDGQRETHKNETQTETSKTHWSRLGDLPDGVFVAREGEAWLVKGGHLRKWTAGGYGRSIPVESDRTGDVLTPRSIVSAFQAGYRPTTG